MEKVIDFEKEKDRIHTNKAWERCKEKVKNLKFVLDLTGEELFSLRMVLETFLEDAKPTKNKTCNDVLDNLQSLLYKVIEEVEVYDE